MLQPLPLEILTPYHRHGGTFDKIIESGDNIFQEKYK